MSDEKRCEGCGMVHGPETANPFVDLLFRVLEGALNATEDTPAGTVEIDDVGPTGLMRGHGHMNVINDCLQVPTRDARGRHMAANVVIYAPTTDDGKAETTISFSPKVMLTPRIEAEILTSIIDTCQSALQALDTLAVAEVIAEFRRNNPTVRWVSV